METGIKINGIDLFDLGKRLVKQIGENDLSGLSAEMAYRFFLSIFPFFIFLAALGGFIASAINIDNPTDEVMALIGDALPEETSTVLRGELQNVIGGQNPGLLSFGIIGTIFAAAGGVNTLEKGFNRSYRVAETRPFWIKTPMNVALVLLAGIAVVAAFILLVMGQIWGTQLANELGLGTVASTLFTLARWPIVALLILIGVAFLYWAAPNVSLPFRLISPGAVVFLVLWLAATWGFGFYVSNFGEYNATYGALGAVVILLLWFYLTGFVLLLGAEINALVLHRVAPEEIPEDQRDRLQDGAIPGDIDEEIARGRREPTLAFSREGGRGERGGVEDSQASRGDSRHRDIERHLERSAPSRRRPSGVEKAGFSVLGAVVATVAAWRLLERNR
jgi:membrane protein